MSDKQHLLSPQQQTEYVQQTYPPPVSPQYVQNVVITEDSGPYQQPSQPQYPPPYQQQTTQTTIYHMHKHFGPLPENHVCQWCGAQIMTRTETAPGMLTYLASGAICLFGLWAGCCLIPFCIDELKDVDHYCPACHQLVGKYSRI